MTEHAEMELAVAEALSGERPLEAKLSAHLAACASCAALRRAFDQLAADAAADPGEAYWRRFDQRLGERLASAGAPAATPRRARAPWRLTLAAAAAVLLAALAAWRWQRAPSGTSPPGGGDEPAVAAVADDRATRVLAAASADGVQAGLLALGLGEWEEVESTTDNAREATLAASPLDELPPPAWDDVVGEVGEELAVLDPVAQAAAARALREAT